MPRAVQLLCEGCDAETLQPLSAPLPRGWLLRRIVDECVLANGHAIVTNLELLFCSKCALGLQPVPPPDVLAALKGATS